MADTAQPAGGFHEARQSLVDGRTAGDVQKVLRRAHPRSSIVVGHPLHDLVGYAIHWITPVPLLFWSQKYIRFFILNQSEMAARHAWPRVIDAYDELFATVARA